MLIRLNEIKEGMKSKVGGKAYQLGRLLQKDIRVPQGFVVTTEMYDAYIKLNGIDALITQALDSGSPMMAQEMIQQAFMDGSFDPETMHVLNDAFEAIQKPLAVRSSSTMEDLSDYSFAGQYDSFLNIYEWDGFKEVLKRTWASLWNERAIIYRKEHRLDGVAIQHAVLVQELVQGEKSGVAFTANPVTGIRHHALINSAWGLGESIVGGHVTPDEWIVDRKTQEIVHEQIHTKRIKTVCTDDGTKEVATLEQEADAPSLNAEEVKALVEGLNRIEAFYEGEPQDTEWVIRNGQVYFVQSRAITTLYPIPKPFVEPPHKKRCYICFSTMAQGIHEPFTPMGIESYRLLFSAYIEAFAGKRVDYPDWVGTAAGRFYMDVSDALGKKKMASKVPKRMEGKDIVASKALTQYIERDGAMYLQQGGRFKMSPKMLGIYLHLTKHYFKGVRLKEKAYDRMLEMGDGFVDKTVKDIEALKSIDEKLEYVRTFMLRMSNFGFTSFTYCMDPLIYMPKLEKKLKGWLGQDFDLSVIKQALDNNPTSDMGERLMELAVAYKRNQTHPHIEDVEIQSFLKAYGHRGSVEMDIGVERWDENPTYIIEMIQSYMEGNPEGMLAAYRQKSKDAEGLIDEIVKRLAPKIGAGKAQKVKAKLVLYRHLVGMREQPKFDMIRGYKEIRKMVLSIGEELVHQGRLADSKDVFFLYYKDILDKDSDLVMKAQANRKMYLEQFRYKRIPPIIINDGEAIYNYTMPEEEGVINGNPIAPGVFTGTVKVIEHLGDDEINDGEILITHSTNPAWTPLFLKAGALIMESGGPISHGSVVAREYGIPAVVYGDILKKVKSGDMIQVNGDTGQILQLSVLDGVKEDMAL